MGDAYTEFLAGQSKINPAIAPEADSRLAQTAIPSPTALVRYPRGGGTSFQGTPYDDQSYRSGLRKRNAEAKAAAAQAAGTAASAAAAQGPDSRYANGGDGRVAGAAPIRERSASVGMGMTREELLRRMENVATSAQFKGSPSARQAMMGAYADALKTHDQVGIDANQGNIRHDGLMYDANAAANRQEALGRQQFGNEVGLQDRKTAGELAIAQAGLDPEKRELEMLKLRTEIAQKQVETGMKARSFDLNEQAQQDSTLKVRAEQIGFDPKDPASKAAAYDQAAREMLMLNGIPESIAEKRILHEDGTNVASQLGAWNRINGWWAANNTRQLDPGTVIDMADVTLDYGTEEDDNNWNDWFGWVPGVDKDQRVVYTNPKTGEKHTQWLDLSESEDKALVDKVAFYQNSPAFQQQAALRRKQNEK